MLENKDLFMSSKFLWTKDSLIITFNIYIAQIDMLYMQCCSKGWFNKYSLGREFSALNAALHYQSFCGHIVGILHK
jgi:hypothetical protein